MSTAAVCIQHAFPTATPLSACPLLPTQEPKVDGEQKTVAVLKTPASSSRMVPQRLASIIHSPTSSSVIGDALSPSNAPLAGHGTTCATRMVPQRLASIIHSPKQTRVDPQAATALLHTVESGSEPSSAALPTDRAEVTGAVNDDGETIANRAPVPSGSSNAFRENHPLSNAGSQGRAARTLRKLRSLNFLSRRRSDPPVDTARRTSSSPGRLFRGFRALKDGAVKSFRKLASGGRSGGRDVQNES